MFFSINISKLLFRRFNNIKIKREINTWWASISDVVELFGSPSQMSNRVGATEEFL